MLGIGHERRYEPAIVEVRRLIKEGVLGTVMHVEANFSHDKLANVPAGDWRTSSKDAPAAGMTAMGIHLSDLYVELFGPVQRGVRYDDLARCLSREMVTWFQPCCGSRTGPRAISTPSW